MPAPRTLAARSAGHLRPAGRETRAPALVDASAVAQRRLQRALGLLWLIDGALQLQPFMYSGAFVTRVLTPQARDQPRILGHAILLAAQLFARQPAAFNTAAAALQIAIGSMLLHRSRIRLGLALSLAWGLGVWCFGEGLGGLLNGTASPLGGAPGAAALYALASIVLWPAARPPAATAASRGLLGDTGARVAWAALWLLLGALWLGPASTAPDAVARTISGAPAGAGWLTAIQDGAGRAAAGHGLALAVILAGLCCAIAAGALLDQATRPLLVLAASIAVGCWLLGQALGGIPTGQATDPGTGPLLVLLAASLAPADRIGGCAARRRGHPQ